MGIAICERPKATMKFTLIFLVVILVAKPWECVASTIDEETRQQGEAVPPRRVSESDCRPAVRTSNPWLCLRHPQTNVPVQVVCENYRCLIQCEAGEPTLCRLQKRYMNRRTGREGFEPIYCPRASLGPPTACMGAETNPGGFVVGIDEIVESTPKSAFPLKISIKFFFL